MFQDLFSALHHLKCPNCGKEYSADTVVGTCDCGSPLFVIYHMRVVEEAMRVDLFPTGVNSLWRYSMLLPLRSPQYVITLGEGWTPLIQAPRLSEHYGLRMLRVKCESQNPTGSFKDRGLSVTVSRHVELGCDKFALPTAGNAGVALSAYCARAGVRCRVYMPEDTPDRFVKECERYGAEVFRVEGTISECRAAMIAESPDFVDLSTTREPYRVEGKKTIGFEIAEQLEWNMPDVIVCPTGGGTALLGIWKAIGELRALGLMDKHDGPRLVAAQSEHCAPVVRAVERGDSQVETWEGPETAALGLRVPSPFAKKLIPKAIRQTKGTAVAVAENDMWEAQRLAAKLEGLDIGPEAAVGLAGIGNLVEAGEIDPDEEVVLLNTGGSARYG